MPESVTTSSTMSTSSATGSSWLYTHTMDSSNHIVVFKTENKFVDHNIRAEISVTAGSVSPIVATDQLLTYATTATYEEHQITITPQALAEHGYISDATSQQPIGGTASYYNIKNATIETESNDNADVIPISTDNASRSGVNIHSIISASSTTEPNSNNTYFLAFKGTGQSVISSSGWISTSGALAAATATKYFTINTAVMSVSMTSSTITPSVSIGGSNVVLSDTDTSGITVTATGGGSATFTAAANVTSHGYAPVKDNYKTQNFTINSNTTTATQYITAVTVGANKSFSVTNNGTTTLVNNATANITNNTAGIISMTSTGKATINNSTTGTYIGSITLVNSGTANITNSNSMSITNTGIITITSSGTATLVTSGTSTITNSGTATFTNSKNATITTSGTATITNSGTATITNQKKLTIGQSASGATLSITSNKTVTITNNAGGTVNITSTGTVNAANNNVMTVTNNKTLNIHNANAKAVSITNIGSVTITHTSTSGTVVIASKTESATPQTIISKGDWVTTTLTASTATTQTAYGKVVVNQLGVASFSNTFTGSNTHGSYEDISSGTAPTAPVLISGGGLYINEGYVQNTYISLARLVPDSISATNGFAQANYILRDWGAFDEHGGQIIGTIDTYLGAYEILTVS